LAHDAATTALRSAASNSPAFHSDVEGFVARVTAASDEAVQELADQLDEAAWAAEERAAFRTTEYWALFRLARAVDAVRLSRTPDPRRAAAEALYEAYVAIGEDADLFFRLGVYG
jgi:hypothetical protein